jgi:tRNA(Ile)-lysidine synthase
LLRLRRAETLLVCRAARLAPVMDPTNDDPAMVRNRVRHDLIPRCNEIAARDVVPVLARQTSLLAEESEVLEQLASTVDPTSTAALAAAPAALARRAVRAWLRDGTVYPPSSASVERVLAVARGSPRACEVEGGRRVRRSRGRLFLEPSRPPAGAGAAATVATGDEDL